MNLHGLVSHQTLKPRVLFFQRSEPLGFADFHPSELSLPRMVGRRNRTCLENMDSGAGITVVWLWTFRAMPFAIAPGVTILLFTRMKI